MNKKIEYFRSKIHEYNILEKYNLPKLTVFGSLARGEDSNDIDIYIEKYDNYEQIIQLKDELEKIFDKHIDIMLKEYANPIVFSRAKKDFVDVA